MLKLIRACAQTGKVLNQENEYPPTSNSTTEYFFETLEAAYEFIEEDRKKVYNVEYILWQEDGSVEVLYAPAKKGYLAYAIDTTPKKKRWPFQK